MSNLHKELTDVRRKKHIWHCIGCNITTLLKIKGKITANITVFTHCIWIFTGVDVIIVTRQVVDWTNK